MTRFPAASESLVSPAGGGHDSTMITSSSATRKAGGNTSAFDMSSHTLHSPSPTPEGPGQVTAGGNRVLRTVYLPSERADALLLTTQSLQQQLDEMKKLNDERTEVCVLLTWW